MIVTKAIPVVKNKFKQIFMVRTRCDWTGKETIIIFKNHKGGFHFDSTIGQEYDSSARRYKL